MRLAGLSTDATVFTKIMLGLDQNEGDKPAWHGRTGGKQRNHKKSSAQSISVLAKFLVICYKSLRGGRRMDTSHNGLAEHRVVGSVEPCSHCVARPSTVCAAIDPADLERLARATTPQMVPRGQTFISEGDPADHFFNITSGTARLFKLLPDGRRQITGFARMGYFLGLAVRDAYTFSAVAIEPVHLCRFSRSGLRTMLDDFPAMERRLLETAANDLVTAQEQMLLLGRKTARERLASFLVAQSCIGQHGMRESRRVALPMTRADIADYLGLTIETVSRTFTKLKADHLIELSGPHEVTIRNLAGLEGIAGGLGDSKALRC